MRRRPGTEDAALWRDPTGRDDELDAAAELESQAGAVAGPGRGRGRGGPHGGVLAPRRGRDSMGPPFTRDKGSS